MNNDFDLTKKIVQDESISPGKLSPFIPLMRSKRNNFQCKQLSLRKLYSVLNKTETDRQKIDWAYELILGRAPDQLGFNIHLNILKEQGLFALIYHLRFSKEGIIRKTRINGVFLPYLKWFIKNKLRTIKSKI